MSFKSLAHIIQARMEEIVMYVFQLIHKSGYADKLGSGIVITGGTSLLPNLTQLIKFKTGFDVRIGKPNLNGFVPRKEVYDPRFATVLGLLSMAALEGDTNRMKKRRKKEKAEPSGPGIIESMKVKISQGKGKIGQIVIGFFEDNPDDTEMS
jgi:cell division protein FtsA